MEKITAEQIRVVTEEDNREIFRLLRQSPFSHVHLDWRMPVDWIGDPGFVVLPKQPTNSVANDISAKLLGTQNRIDGCLAITADPLPAAWVRLASVTAKLGRPRAFAILEQMLANVLPGLQEKSVTEIGWFLTTPWPESWFSALGFRIETYVAGYRKNGSEIPAAPTVPGLLLRPIDPDEFDDLVNIEEHAFAPLWRHSAETLKIAYEQTISFDTAELEGKIVGYQFSTHSNDGAHLARMSVHPQYQGRGIGAALLVHAIEGYRQQGLKWVTLNTQVDNEASQRLYHRFGFRPTGEKFPVRVKPINKT